MPFISVTRLRVRRLRFLPAFFFHAGRAQRQLRGAAGFAGGALLPDRRWTFWTLTGWDDAASMRAYMLGGPHKAAMPRLMHWCDEASVVHWETDAPGLPGWDEAEARMRRDGRPSRLLHPGADHAAMAFAPMRPGRGAAIAPR